MNGHYPMWVESAINSLWEHLVKFSPFWGPHPLSSTDLSLGTTDVLLRIQDLAQKFHERAEYILRRSDYYPVGLQTRSLLALCRLLKWYLNVVAWKCPSCGTSRDLLRTLSLQIKRRITFGLSHSLGKVTWYLRIWVFLPLCTLVGPGVYGCLTGTTLG